MGQMDNEHQSVSVSVFLPREYNRGVRNEAIKRYQMRGICRGRLLSHMHLEHIDCICVRASAHSVLLTSKNIAILGQTRGQGWRNACACYVQRRVGQHCPSRVIWVLIAACRQQEPRQFGANLISK